MYCERVNQVAAHKLDVFSLVPRIPPVHRVLEVLPMTANPHFQKTEDYLSSGFQNPLSFLQVPICVLMQQVRKDREEANHICCSALLGYDDIINNFKTPVLVWAEIARMFKQLWYDISSEVTRHRECVGQPTRSAANVNEIVVWP